MDFDLRKKQVLERVDKSSKGSVDKMIAPLLDAINKIPYYYTTSSCSGRIMLIAPTADMKKNQSQVLFCSHDKVTTNDIDSALKSYKGKRTVWLRCEAFILHIACMTKEDAQKILNIAQKLGLKRSGLTSLRNNIVEILSTEKLDTPILINGDITVTDVNSYVTIANDLLDRTHNRLEKFTYAVEAIP